MSIINKRVSVRKFSEQNIADELILEVAQAGLVAPSSKNKQPWQMIVLTKKEILSQFSEFHPNWTIMKNANKAIVVCGDLESDERETQALMACSAATQNILLKCTELELGAVWLGVYPDQSRIDWIKQTLELPQDKIPMSLIAIGYPQTSQTKTRNIDSSKIHFNKW